MLEVGHKLLFALLTKDRHVPKPWEQSPGAPGEGRVRQNVERKAPVCSGQPSRAAGAILFVAHGAILFAAHGTILFVTHATMDSLTVRELFSASLWWGACGGACAQPPQQESTGPRYRAPVYSWPAQAVSCESVGMWDTLDTQSLPGLQGVIKMTAIMSVYWVLICVLSPSYIYYLI